MTKSEYKELCPKLLYYMAFGGNDCKHDGKQNNHSHHHHHQQHSGSGTSASGNVH